MSNDKLRKIIAEVTPDQSRPKLRPAGYTRRCATCGTMITPGQMAWISAANWRHQECGEVSR